MSSFRRKQRQTQTTIIQKIQTKKETKEKIKQKTNTLFYFIIDSYIDTVDN